MVGEQNQPSSFTGGNPQLVRLPGEVMNVVISSRLPCSQRPRQNVRGRGQKENGSPWFKKGRGKAFSFLSRYFSPSVTVCFICCYNVALPDTRIRKRQMLTLAGARGPLHPVTQSPGCAPSPPLPHVGTQVTVWRRATEFKDGGGASRLELLQGSGRRWDSTFSAKGPISHQTSLTKHKFKDKILKNFSMVTAEH